MVREIEFNYAQTQILYGTLFGDANVTSPYIGLRRNASLQIEHSTKQQGWAEFKANMLGLSILTRDRFDKRTNKTYHSVVAYSGASPTYTAIYDRMYDKRGGKKKLDLDILNEMGPLALATWYIDDGCTNYKNRICTLHTEKFTLREVQQIQLWFMDRFELRPIITERPSNGNMHYALSFNAVDSYNLLEIIRPYCPTPDVEYKFIVKPYSRIPKWQIELREVA